MEYRVDDGSDLRDGSLAGCRAENDAADNQENDKSIADPQEVDTYRVENEPVRLGDERETVGVVAEQKQYAQDDVHRPCGKRDQDKVLEGCDAGGDLAYELF